MQSLLQAVVTLAKQAGAAIMPYYGKAHKQDVKYKDDDSPLTQADLAANQIIVDGLSALTPDIPIISEEQKNLDYETRKQWLQNWLVDPLDGTRAFIKNRRDFTVNIALIDQHRSVLGVIYVPVSDTLYFAAAGQGAYKQVGDSAAEKIHCKPLGWDALDIVISEFHSADSFADLDQQKLNYQLRRVNSSVKFASVAQGQADVYPRAGPTSEWDTAAGQCVLEQAGGLVVDFAGEKLQYSAKSSLRNPGFIAIGDASQVDQVIKIFNFLKT